ncbi:MAG: hypothetical protein ABIK61_00840 [candidate division WOR-3 bacterium]
MLRIKDNPKICFILLCFFMIVNAEINWNGYIQTDNRLLIKDWSLSWQEYRLSLQTDYKPNTRIRFFSEIWLRSLGFTDVYTSTDLNNRRKVAPTDFDLREAYIDLYGFINKNLDLRIGRQRIAWGVADRVNPTDNLNPNDFEDIWDFGRHLASNGIVVSYYINDLSLKNIFIPSFTPAILSPRINQSLLISSMLPVMHYQNISDTILLPSSKLKDAVIYGAKVSKPLSGFDFSLSYIYGRYDLPMLKKMTFTLADTTGAVNLVSEYIYPRIQILGFDFAGAIKEVGIWAEMAIYLPKKTYLTIDMTTLGLGSFDTLILTNKPYARYILGLDYTFVNGIYINLQYLHGFVTEYGKDNLHDYFMLGIDWKILQDKLKFSPLNCALEIKKWQDFKNSHSIVFTPEISYKPFDNTELNLGCRYLDGNSMTTFGQLKDEDELYLKVKYHF